MTSTAAPGLETPEPVHEVSVATHYSPISSLSFTEEESLPERAVSSKSAELTGYAAEPSYGVILALQNVLDI